MRKLLIVALGLSSIAIFTEPVLATKILNHTANEIEAYCNKIGGKFEWNDIQYWCRKPDGHLVICWWGDHSCSTFRQSASTGKTAGNTRNLGPAAAKPPAAHKVTTGGLSGTTAIMTSGPAHAGTVPAASTKREPVGGANVLGGGAFGGSSSPTMPGVDRATGRKLP
jgi:hypothetical protein